MASPSNQDLAQIVKRFNANSAYLADAVNRVGPNVLPSGYTLRVTSQDRPGSTVAGTGGVSQHSLGKAIDFAIYDPSGAKLPNYQVADDSGLYGKVALAVRNELPPEAQGQLAWGGNFGIRDLMHLDFGGDRGRLGSLSQMAGGGAPSPRYAASPAPGVATGMRAPTDADYLGGGLTMSPDLVPSNAAPAAAGPVAPTVNPYIKAIALQGLMSGPMSGPSSMADVFAPPAPVQQSTAIDVPPQPVGGPLPLSRRLG
jgi:hypothetical protein